MALRQELLRRRAKQQEVDNLATEFLDETAKLTMQSLCNRSARRLRRSRTVLNAFTKIPDGDRRIVRRLRSGIAVIRGLTCGPLSESAIDWKGSASRAHRFRFCRNAADGEVKAFVKKERVGRGSRLQQWAVTSRPIEMRAVDACVLVKVTTNRTRARRCASR